MTEFDKNQLIFNINCIKKPPKEFFFRGLVNLCIRCPIISWRTEVHDERL